MITPFLPTEVHGDCGDERSVFGQILIPDSRELSKGSKILEGGFENAIF
jgi:hypothetical protein